MPTTATASNTATETHNTLFLFLGFFSFLALNTVAAACWLACFVWALRSESASGCEGDDARSSSESSGTPSAVLPCSAFSSALINRLMEINSHFQGSIAQAGELANIVYRTLIRRF